MSDAVVAARGDQSAQSVDAGGLRAHDAGVGVAPQVAGQGALHEAGVGALPSMRRTCAQRGRR
jgi:hypothetical protein